MCEYEDDSIYEEMKESAFIAETADLNFKAHQSSSRSQDSFTYLSSQCSDTKASPTAKRYSNKSNWFRKFELVQRVTYYIFNSFMINLFYDTRVIIIYKKFIGI